MRISPKSKLATSVLLDIAAHTQHGFLVSTSVLVKRHKISLSYLEQILRLLSTSGLIKSFRGPAGGYALIKNPEQVSIFDIVSLSKDNDYGEDILSVQLWTSFREYMQEQMSKITLTDLLKMIPVEIEPSINRIKTISTSSLKSVEQVLGCKKISKIAYEKKHKNLGPNSIFTFGQYLKSI